MWSRVLAAAGLAVASALLVTAPAGADGLVVDGTSVTATEADGVATAKISVLNTGESPVDLPEDVAVSGTCRAKVTDPTVKGLRSTTVTLTFDVTCFEDAASVEADLDGAGPLPAVTIKKPQGRGDWAPMGYAALIAAGLTGAALIVGLIMVWLVDRQLQHPTGEDKERADKRVKAYQQLKDIVGGRVEALGHPHDTPLRWKPLASRKYGLKSEVKGLQAAWSVKDSWASNITLTSAAFIALFNSADTLKTLLGEKPDAALGVMTVSGLISAVVIAVANTAAKVFGSTLEQVTTFGLVLSTSLVVGAASFQTATVGWATVTLVSDRVVDFLVVAGTVAVAAVLIVYASLATWRTLKSGARPQPIPAVPADAFSSWDASDGHDGVDPWKASVVRDRIEAAYADFLERPDASVSARRTMPIMVQVAPSGEFVATRRASLL